jgi:polyhydroxyalkanoate synthase
MIFKLAESIFTTFLGKPTPPIREEYGTARADARSQYRLLLDQPTLKLRRYDSRKRKRSRIPVLLVPPLMLTADLFDLHPRRSLVRHLLAEGFDVFLVDFGKPRNQDRVLSLSRYIGHRLHEAVRKVKKATGSAELSLVGYCMGGLFVNAYAALHPRSGVRNIVNIGGPSDFSPLALYRNLGHLSRQPLEALARTYGYIPAPLCNAAFHAVHPDTILRNPLTFLRSLGDPTYPQERRADGGRNLEYVHLPEAAFLQLWNELLIENRLHRDLFTVASRTVKFSKIRASYLAIAGRQDRLIPSPCVFSILKKLRVEDKSAQMAPGGHLGMLIGNRADQTWRHVGDWLGARSRKASARRPTRVPVRRTRIPSKPAARVASAA